MLRSLTRRDIKSPFLRDPNAGSPRTQEDSSLSKGIARPIGVGTLAANTRRNTTTFEQQLDPCRLAATLLECGDFCPFSKFYLPTRSIALQAPPETIQARRVRPGFCSGAMIWLLIGFSTSARTQRKSVLGTTGPLTVRIRIKKRADRSRGKARVSEVEESLKSRIATGRGQNEG
jgi:hypothetical protein